MYKLFESMRKVWVFKEYSDLLGPILGLVLCMPRCNKWAVKSKEKIKYIYQIFQTEYNVGTLDNTHGIALR